MSWSGLIRFSALQAEYQQASACRCASAASGAAFRIKLPAAGCQSSDGFDGGFDRPAALLVHCKEIHNRNRPGQGCYKPTRVSGCILAWNNGGDVGGQVEPRPDDIFIHCGDEWAMPPCLAPGAAICEGERRVQQHPVEKPVCKSDPARDAGSAGGQLEAG